MPDRARVLGVLVPSDLPSKTISPEVGKICPPSMLSTVDLPAPFGPMNTWMSCSRMSRSTPSTALNGPYDLDRPRVEIRTPVVRAAGSSTAESGGYGGACLCAEQLRGVVADHAANVPLGEAVVQQPVDEDAQALVRVRRRRLTQVRRQDRARRPDLADVRVDLLPADLAGIRRG